MYYFEDTLEKGHKDELILPSSAMMYDGVYIEKMIEGYRTLAVTGREMLSLDIETQNTQVGSIKLNQKLPARTIKVTYQLMGKNAQDVQKKYHRLMQLLYREKDVELRFKDELDYHYYGQYVTTDEVRGDTNNIIASFELLCNDPKKYSLLLSTDSQITTYLPYPVTPEKITVTIAKFGTLLIQNEDKTIKITSYNLSADDQVVFDFLKGKVFVNGIDQTFLLDLESDFENFSIKEGQTITCSNGPMTIAYREVQL
ncbi:MULTISPECIES: distal tail protein Dit [unclassified Enterococcus]|uniref:distal tail protein Dit n=1 Tax=unclassified Enterococcus TaxID=2608891 RepID=UPI001CE0C2AF|nr:MULTISPECIES: distal tail protein Dit [unclassified Enterococcus]MCA5012411.1 phage tail family protein [Enterococcus sp. S23]MCA5015662.1 phage tail family protein [Enterococcus sp. S22(2020)]